MRNAKSKFFHDKIGESSDSNDPRKTKKHFLNRKESF